jgi:hypothetical protein
MTNCTIYVKSRGFSQNHDYRWVDNENKLVQEPDSVTKVQDLIESESFSVVISRGNDKQNKEYLLLLITGIQLNRKDVRNRTILTSIAWECYNTEENEKYLRAIASNVLESNSKVKDEIKKSIEASTEHGFEAVFNKLHNLTLETVENNPPKLNQWFDKNLPENQQKLSEYLKNSRLPTSQQLNKVGLMSKNTALVVVTGIKLESAFKEAGIWRGLSNLVGESSNKLEEKSSKNWKLPDVYSSIKAIVIIVLCASLILNVVQYNQIQDLSSQVQKNNKEIQDLQDRYKDFGKQQLQEFQNKYEDFGKQQLQEFQDKYEDFGKQQLQEFQNKYEDFGKQQLQQLLKS